MDKEIDRILKDVMALPLEARAALAGSLLESLDTTVDEDAEEAWRREIERRMKEVDSGRVKLVPWSEARARLMATRKNDR